ncbi:hypothetical protein, partial [Haladaptatus sp.]|uniref:hypothetical protein n=1 Tax=Haladaptatus sp. TaxID=1973141 RepID=UPI003C498FB5
MIEHTWVVSSDPYPWAQRLGVPFYLAIEQRKQWCYDDRPALVSIDILSASFLHSHRSLLILFDFEDTGITSLAGGGDDFHR